MRRCALPKQKNDPLLQSDQRTAFLVIIAVAIIDRSDSTFHVVQDLCDDQARHADSSHDGCRCPTKIVKAKLHS